jgi:disulfide bond formation protein DsbB
MSIFLSSSVPYIILASHLLAIVVIFSLLLKNKFAFWLGQHSVALGFITAVVTVLGSMFYSNVMGFEPCELCWWQRVLLFPQLVLFGVALWKKSATVFSYAVPMVIISSVISLYNLYIQMGGNPFVPCSATASCTKVYVMVFGYISIPVMALTASLGFLLLAWARKIYENNSHS